MYKLNPKEFKTLNKEAQQTQSKALAMSNLNTALPHESLLSRK
jgi:hypothetical protein